MTGSAIIWEIDHGRWIREESHRFAQSLATVDYKFTPWLRFVKREEPKWPANMGQVIRKVELK